MASEAIDDYLKAIFQIAGDEDRATTAALAEKLSVSPASVTGMLKKLFNADPPWIEYQKHHGARLSPRGQARALEVIRHHRLIELFLHTVLGYRWDEVHAEAERLEHAISETFEDRIAEVLGDPEFDPHGHPIPRRDGSLPKRSDTSLLHMEPGTKAVVSRVSDQDSQMLQYLSSIGVKPGIRIHLVERGPFDGPLMLRVEEAAKVYAFGRRLAAAIRVQQRREAGA
jgi:DtxR family Mn-dependent transcriptional regulator